MADTHIEFQDFIKELDLRNGQEAKLQSSRDALIGRITSHFGSKGLKSPRFESQGSYALATQNRPIDDDFDLDQGVYLQHYEDSASVSVHDAMTLIEDATNGHTSQPNPPKPTCVRVLYKAASDGTPAHHVDLAVYREKANGEKLYANRDNGWMASDQKGFIEHFKNNKSDQMHRLVRLLKGWADFNGGDDDSKMPSGFHLTVCVLECFVESKDRDDKALVETAEQILKRIQGAYIQKSGSPIIRPVIPVSYTHLTLPTILRV